MCVRGVRCAVQPRAVGWTLDRGDGVSVRTWVRCPFPFMSGHHIYTVISVYGISVYP